METATINIFEFSELSPAAKDTARQWHESHGDWFRDSEFVDSLKALAEHFDGKLSNWSIDWSGCSGPSSAEFEMPSMTDREISRRLRALGTFNFRTLKGHGSCKLTGCGTDEDAIYGFRWAWYRDGSRSLDELMQTAFETWIKAAHSNYEYDYGDEGLSETSDANDWRYTKSGKFWSKKNA